MLDEFIQVGGEQLEDEAEVVPVDERVAQPQNVMLVVRIELLVELSRVRACTITRGRGRTSSKIVTSIILWLKYAGLFLTTFTATTS